ncbi:dorsal-ventral patterning tolloid-like protein 1 [Limulus polyphemus]|uniref:Dorsal-ventral patterning tolloid-like protein 1 n=1 Tax=Limulus polyphemus TaxID=6850 RepID=A0ABM1SD28_LIMPO|nr:dorsal-ventral patterning tolloid-like protein 1 [Limulus polyphemus]
MERTTNKIHFQFHPTLSLKNTRCHLGDYVRLFLHLKESAVDQKTQANSVLCGKMGDIIQTHYSSASALIFEFHTDWKIGNNTGFRGTYRFLNKSLFLNDGDPLFGTKCDYQFFRSNKSQSKGYFFSPLYPSTYPRNVNCAYHFMGKYNERVSIHFEKVRLQPGDISCLYSEDKIKVHDGKDARSPLIGQLCNYYDFVDFLSTGPDLYVEFHSQGHFSGQGFKAAFEFKEENLNVGFNLPSTEPLNNGLRLPVIEERRVHCDVWVTSAVSKNGTITSPNYPDPYPANVHCVYHFTARGKERVQILFTDFDLYQPAHSSTNRDCEGVDVVQAFIKIKGQIEALKTNCGHALPPQLMSNGPYMIMEFHTTKSSLSYKGFQATYRFVSDFGINAGVQDPQSVCGFIFNSWEQTNGTFCSPNHPGLYPRNTECHYSFIGRKTERVQITFTDFDVEGVTPCTEETASDYVEFSSKRSAVFKLARHCGLNKPKTIESEGDFFLVTFRSNNQFDGMGFKAFYQFTNQTNFSTTKWIRDSAGNPYCNLSSILLTVVILCEIMELKLMFVT